MASLVLSGDTSGSITLSAPAVSGTTTITLPTVSGGNFVVSDSSGNVGIGTSSPSYKLQVLDTSATGGISLRDATYIHLFRNRGNTLDIIADTGNTGGDMRFFANGITERMRIDSIGNIYAGGTTSLSNGPYRYNSISNFSTSYGLGIQDTSAGTGGYFIGFLNQSNVVQGSISKTSSTVTAYNTGSDYRLKEDILSMTGALDRIAQLKPVTFKWKEDKLDGEGFIAHELAEVCPQCVTGEKDAVDTQGNPIYQMVDTSFLVATLTAAIQEQQTIINDLKARIETLESK